jgi:hypothetical protein
LLALCDAAEARQVGEVMNLDEELEQAETKAFQSLARYKFMNFGYWAAIWVHLNRISGKRRANPFAMVVKLARGYIKQGGKD